MEKPDFVPKGESARTPTPIGFMFPLGHYRLTFRAIDRLPLPAYSGSAWRGLFGHGLKHTVCVTRKRDCAACMLLRSCVYPYLFETAPDPQSEKMRRQQDVPHPFVLRPDPDLPGELAANERFSLELVLVGRAVSHLAYVLQAFRVAGERGVGKARARFALRTVEQSNLTIWQPIYADGGALDARPPRTIAIPPVPEEVRIRIQTPLRLRREGTLITPRNFRFQDLFGNLLRRISMLSYFHTDWGLETDFRGLVDAARALEVTRRDLHWREWTRYSSRQQRRLQMGGLVGSIALEGEDLAPFWPYLWLGQWVHAGKGAVMGLGRYRLTAECPLPATLV
jgi:hypothetical protein